MKLDLSVTAADLTASLVSADSVSGNEQPLADLIATALADLPHLTLHRAGNAIVARTELSRAERVAIAGHIDTVPVAGNLPLRLAAGVLHGLGSSGMKSGAAVQLRLAALLPQPSRDVTYVFYDGEEIEAERNGRPMSTASPSTRVSTPSSSAAAWPATSSRTSAS